MPSASSTAAASELPPPAASMMTPKPPNEPLPASAEVQLAVVTNSGNPSAVASVPALVESSAMAAVAAPVLPPGFEDYIQAQKAQFALGINSPPIPKKNASNRDFTLLNVEDKNSSRVRLDDCADDSDDGEGDNWAADAPTASRAASKVPERNLIPKSKRNLVPRKGEDEDLEEDDAVDEGLDGLASQWGKLSLKQDIEGGTFSFNPDVEPTGLDGQPLEFFLLGTVRAVESFNPRSVEKAMLGAWSPRKTMEMTVIDENLYLFRFTHRLDINRAIREAPWRFQEYVLALQEVPRGFVVPKESLVMVPFWIQLYGVPVLWQREDVARFIGNLLGTVHDVDPKVRRHTGGGEPFLRVKVEVNTAVELVRGTTVVLGDSSVPIALKYERLFKFCSYCGLVDHVLDECEETLKPGFNIADCKYGEWLKGIPPRSSPWHADNWKPLGGNMGNPFAQKKQAIPPGFRALPAPVGPAPLPSLSSRVPTPIQNSYKAPIVFSAARQGSTNDGKSKRRTTKGLRIGDQGMKKADESLSSSKRRRGEESSSHKNDSTELN